MTASEIAFEEERRRLLSIPRVILARMAESDDPAVAVHLQRHLGEDWANHAR